MLPVKRSVDNQAEFGPDPSQDVSGILSITKNKK